MDVGLTTLVSLLTGAVLVPLLQWLKRRTGLKGEAMRWVAFLITWGMTVVVLLITGKVSAAQLKAVDFYIGLFSGTGANQVFYAFWKGVNKALEENGR